MRLREHEEPLDPHAERELAALDDALTGRPVDPDLRDVEELALLLREERPEPDPGWAAELDERVEKRFSLDGSESWRELIGRLRALPPRRIGAPIAAAAMVAVVAVVAVSTLGSDSGDDHGTAPSASSKQLGDLQLYSGGSDDSSAPGDATTSAAESEPVAPSAAAPTFNSVAGGFRRSQTDHRKVDRDVELKLGAAPEDVSPTADDVIRITREAGGYVAGSQVRTTPDGGGATLHLTIPARHLDDAIDELTKLGDVQSLSEATNDITKPYVSAKDRLSDARAEREKLLEALGNATTDEEAEAIRIQLDDVRDQISRAEAVFANVANRARFSQVDVTIVGDPGTAAKSSDDGRSLSDWADDALGVLRDIAGVLLITAAIVVPLGLLAALIWLATTRTRRRRRERALEG
jgi:hypothetical protein